MSLDCLEELIIYYSVSYFHDDRFLDIVSQSQLSDLELELLPRLSLSHSDFSFQNILRFFLSNHD